MFLNRIPSFVAHRLPMITNCLKQGRFISVTSALHAKKANSTPIPDIKKQVDASESKIIFEDEHSKLYPDEWGKINYDISEEFRFMSDNFDQSSDTNPKKKLPETEIVERKRWLESKIPPQSTDREESHKREKESDSDSDGENGMNRDIIPAPRSSCKSVLHKKSKTKYTVNVLRKRSEFFRTKMVETRSAKCNYIKVEGVSEIYSIASLGSKPDMIFTSDIATISGYPGSLEDIQLYEVPWEDLTYWSNVKCKAIALYDSKNLKNCQWTSDRQVIPFSVVCHGVKSSMCLGTILNTSAACSAKVILSSLASRSIWEPQVLRSSEMAGLNIDNESSLTWYEISKRISPSDRVLIVNDVPAWSRKQGDGYTWSEFPTINLYDDLWGGKDVTLLVNGSFNGQDQCVLGFCRDRDARLVTLNTWKPLAFGLAFHVVAFELRRQWLAKSGQIGNKMERATKVTQVDK